MSEMVVVVILILSFVRNRLIIVTARAENRQRETEEWLKEHMPVNCESCLGRHPENGPV
jgi:hypothetical protein